VPLDPKKLRQDAQRLQRARPAVTVGLETTGTTKAIRAALPVIHQLRRDGVSWPAIAQALADQGVVQGKDPIPLTTNRLTALVSQIEKQETKRSVKRGRERSDTTNRQVEAAQRLSLSPDLTPPVPATNLQPSSTEDELRRAAFEKLQNVLKKE
jgi:hypothetical protein